MNRIITMCALCMLYMSCMKSSQVNYIIKGITANVTDGEKVYLKDAEGNRGVIDSTIVCNNSFIFKGTQPKQCFASLSIGKIKTIVVLENGTINVSLDNHGKVSGTPTNDIFNACNENINTLEDELDVLRQQMDKLKEDQEDEITALNKKWREIYNKKNIIVKECINQNLNNIVSAYFLNQFRDNLPNREVVQILNDFSPSVKENGFAKKLVEYQEILKRCAIGQKFTDFKMKDSTDKEIALSDYIGKEKYVLLDFWASWCGPCRGDISYLKAAYQKYASKGFEIVGVSLDSKKENWVKAIEEFSITWPQMSDLKGWKCEGGKLYGIRYIPYTFLIDPNGVIIAKGLRGEGIEKELNEIFK